MAKKATIVLVTVPVMPEPPEPVFQSSYGDRFLDEIIYPGDIEFEKSRRFEIDNAEGKSPGDDKEEEE